jgi:hypothetical protein
MVIPAELASLGWAPCGNLVGAGLILEPAGQKQTQLNQFLPVGQDALAAEFEGLCCGPVPSRRGESESESESESGRGAASRHSPARAVI